MNPGYCPGCGAEDGPFLRGCGPLTLCAHCRYAVIGWMPFEYLTDVTAEEYTRRCLEFLERYWDDQLETTTEDTP